MARWFLWVKIMTIAVTAAGVVALSSCDRSYAALDPSDFTLDKWLIPQDVYTLQEWPGLRKFDEGIQELLMRDDFNYLYMIAYKTNKSANKRYMMPFASRTPIGFSFEPIDNDYSRVIVYSESPVWVLALSSSSETYTIYEYKNTLQIVTSTWSQVQNINAPGRLERTNIVLENITSSSVDVVVKGYSKQYDRVKVQVWRPGYIEESIYAEIIYPSDRVRVSGLMSNTHYNVRVHVEYKGQVGDPVNLDFRTLKTSYLINVRTTETGRQIAFNATNYIYPIESLQIIFTDYKKIEVYADSYLIREHNASSNNETIIIDKDDLEQYLDDQEIIFEIRAYKGTNYDKYEFQIDSSIDPARPIEPGGSDFEPRPPDPPDSSWDIIGWIKYIAGWLVYIVETIVWLLRRLGDLIRSTMVEVSGLSTIISNFLSFLPRELLALIGMGITISILLRVFKR